ncbi:MAG: DUF2796 domain-containing protein, partial [Rhodospirillaceae bacterium]
APAGAADEHREAPPHVHGEAQLSFAAEGARLRIEMDTPLGNLISFEHAPQTPEDHEEFGRMITALSDMASLFTIAGTTCQSTAMDIRGPQSDAHAEHGHEDHDDHAHDHESHDDVGHGNLHVAYDFECEDAEVIESIDVGFFSVFEGFTKIEVVYVGEKTHVFELTGSETRFNIQ